jgi:hypothetical protein
MGKTDPKAPRHQQQSQILVPLDQGHHIRCCGAGSMTRRTPRPGVDGKRAGSASNTARRGQGL